MRIGRNSCGTSRRGFDDTLSRFSKAEADGFHSYWASSTGYDALMLLALARRVTKTLELGTAVAPTYPRHPLVMAQQTLTAQAALGNRFVLGIGLSHRVSMQDRLGLDVSKPILHMREYLTVLNGLLSGQPTQFAGKRTASTHNSTCQAHRSRCRTGQRGRNVRQLRQLGVVSLHPRN